MSELFAESLGAPPRTEVFGLFSLSNAMFTCFGITIFLSLLAFLLTRRLKVETPGRVQVVVEAVVGFINSFCQEHLGRHGKTYAPWLGTVALFILCCNLVGLFGLAPPTKALSVPLALTILSILLIYGSQFICNGFSRGLKKFAEPYPLLLPLNVLEVAIRPISLCMRLFGNILAAHLLMEMIRFLCPVVLPAIFSIYFDLFDGLLQAAVFTFLTLLFLSEAIHNPDEPEAQH